ncbi:putative Vacuolar-processing enzyme [Blattamonas nauphoetae]|uniref:Vacuolar-processing enzyme n=1 Tax=Blattamonas nauphoetae TaxID=2049346 RepID=A0ABQ9WR63_9EUKA|nr:putative Vacuolar-processing enzyme [Blattamonas nauphoetae]
MPIGTEPPQVTASATGKFPGQIFNYPDGPNVYIGTDNIDYTGRDVTAEKFFAVLKGDRAKAGGKVLETTENDNIFIHYNDHGNPGFVFFPTGGHGYAKDLKATLAYMTAHKRYKHILFYMEACFSGTMFDKILKNNTGIYAVTAANTQESSYAEYCGISKYRGACLSNEFSQRWMEISDAVDLKSYSVQRQFETARSKTTGSHVMEYGDLSLKSLPLSEFQAGTDEKSFLPPDLQDYVHMMKKSPDMGVSVPQTEAHIFTLQSMAENDPFGPIAKEYHEQYQLKIEEARRSDSLAAFFQTTVKDALRNAISPDDSDLYKWTLETYEEKCGRLNEFNLWNNAAVLAQAVQDGKLNDAKSRRRKTQYTATFSLAEAPTEKTIPVVFTAGTVKSTVSVDFAAAATSATKVIEIVDTATDGRLVKGTAYIIISTGYTCNKATFTPEDLHKLTISSKRNVEGDKPDGAKDTIALTILNGLRIEQRIPAGTDVTATLEINDQLKWENQAFKYAEGAKSVASVAAALFAVLVLVF